MMSYAFFSLVNLLPINKETILFPYDYSMTFCLQFFHHDYSILIVPYPHMPKACSLDILGFEWIASVFFKVSFPHILHD